MTGSGGIWATAPVLRSPLASVHAALGAQLTTEAGAELVSSYADPEVERVTAARGVGIADVTVRGKIDVRGSVDREVAEEAGAARIADDWILLLLAPGPVAKRVASLQTRVGGGAMVTDVTHLYAGFALAGPAADDVVARVTSWDPSTLAVGAVTGAPIADVRSIVARRAAAVPVLEVFVAMEFAGYVWRSLLDASRPLDGHPVGWDALRAQGWS